MGSSLTLELFELDHLKQALFSSHSLPLQLQSRDQGDSPVTPPEMQSKKNMWDHLPRLKGHMYIQIK